MKGACFSIPGHGHVNPSLKIIHTLIEQGEEVDFYCTEEFRKNVEQTGANFIPIGKQFIKNNNLIDFNVLGVFADLIETTYIIMPWLLEIFKNKTYDYIITDLYAVWGRVLGEELQLPTVIYCPSFAQVKALKQPPHSILQLLSTPIKSAPHFFRITHFFKQLKKQYKLRNIQKMNDFLIKPVPNLCLVLTTRTFQPQAYLFPAHYHFIGPAISDNIRSETINFDLDRLKNTPVIYISLGSVLSNRKFYKKCIQAFSNTPYTVVINISVHLNVQDFVAPSNFIIQNYIPQLKVLQHTNVFITHGGMNSVHEGLFYGVPLLVVPQVSDQFLIAQAVKKNALGIWLTERFLSPKKLLRVTQKVHEDHLIQRNIKAMKERLQRFDSATIAANKLLDYIQNTSKNS